MEAVLRLVFTLAIVVLPTVLFLGLWHGLIALRDDKLVMRLETEYYADSTVAPQPTFLTEDVAAVLPGQWLSSGVQCSNCGAENPEGTDHCRQCSEKLP
ncbi:MAG: zinc ribbon domain-containing protein [Halapricum sp.]|jgi:hypothetical protein